MYSNVKSVQILIALLKESGIKRVVHSPGGCGTSIGRSIEQDPFFEAYSVVDERSAVFFAIGMQQATKEPVAVVCTSGTAACNYSSGVAEAYNKEVPLLIITADRHPYLLGQQEIQKIDQVGLFDNMTKYSASLPVIKDEMDAWYCERCINEAILKMEEPPAGPVHLNVSTYGDDGKYACQALPKVKRIEKITMDNPSWNDYASKLAAANRVLVLLGEGGNYSQEDWTVLDAFAERYGAVMSVEHMSDYKGKEALITYRATEGLSREAFDKLVPEIVIDTSGNLITVGMKEFLRGHAREYEHWGIREDGFVADGYMSLTSLFECSPMTFFTNMVEEAERVGQRTDSSYKNAWKDLVESVEIEDVPFSNFYVASELAKRIPSNSMLELGILNSTRIMQYFDLDPSIYVTSNVGALGIDGSLSTAIGRAAASDKLQFVLLGDLSFFYDMNSLNVRYIGNNLRVVLLNNGGGGEFHIGNPKNHLPACYEEFILARHDATAEAWATSRGFEYLKASSKQEFDTALSTLIAPHLEHPVFVEVFLDMGDDAALLEKIREEHSHSPNSEKIKRTVKNIVKRSDTLMSLADKIR